MSMEDLKQIAESVRSFLEDLQETENCWDEDLCGGCAVAAHTITRLLKRAGYRCALVVADGDMGGHCWTEVILEDNQVIVVDVTATQFSEDLPRVLILPKEEYEKLDFFEMFSVFHRKRKAVEQFEFWCYSQRPTTYATKLRKVLKQQVGQEVQHAV